MSGCAHDAAGSSSMTSWTPKSGILLSNDHSGMASSVSRISVQGRLTLTGWLTHCTRRTMAQLSPQPGQPMQLYGVSSWTYHQSVFDDRDGRC